ncbi:MAG: hypothetical protein FJY73_13670 [Candidatus Eisenbacteria bacterium]|nr:hypothetical protein [Candidatus Eisenbacteria bacterium]
MRLPTSVMGVLVVGVSAGAVAGNSVPGNTSAILFTPCEWQLGYDGEAFESTCNWQGYRVIPVRDEIENTTPAVTPQEFRNYLQAGYGVWFIDTHGSRTGFTIAAYESTDAGRDQRNGDFDYWISHGFDGCIRKSAFPQGVGIEYDIVCAGIDYVDVNGEVYNTACFGATYAHVAWFEAAVTEGYPDTSWTAVSDAELFWRRKNGQYGKSYRLSGKARQGMELKYFGDSTMVLSPTVAAVYPPSGSSVGGIDGYMEFDCNMDRTVDPRRIVQGYGHVFGGWILAKNAEWVSDTRIAYRVSPMRVGSGCGVLIDSAVARSVNGQYLDGNQNPIGYDGRGPNRDQYKVSYVAVDLDTSIAASFEGMGAFAEEGGGSRVWWITDPERGSRSFTVFGDGVPVETVPAAGAPGKPHYYEVRLPRSYASYRVIETCGDGSVGSETRSFPLSEPPKNLDGLRAMNELVEGWHSRLVEPGEWKGSPPQRSPVVRDFYYVSRFQDLLNASAPVRDWWASRGFTSTTVLLSTPDPDELHALAQAVYADAMEAGHPRLPMFVIVGEANEGLEPYKNIVGMYYPADVDSGCWWACASDAMTFDVDGDTLADLPWTRVVGFTYQEITREVSSTMEWLNGIRVEPSNRTLFTVGDRTASCTAVAEPLATLLEVKARFESEQVPTLLLKDSDYGCYNFGGRLRDWCASVDASVGGVFISGQVSNRSNWCYFPTWTQNPPFALDSLKTRQRFILHGPGCGIGDTHRNNPQWYPSLLKALMAADPAVYPSIVGACAHLVGGWCGMHTEWAKMYTEHLFKPSPVYQEQVFRAYRQMGIEERSMKPYLRGVGVFGFPIPPHGLTCVGVEEEKASVGPRIVLTCLPNPFNPATTIRFDLPEERRVSLRIYDLAGRCVATLVDGERRTAGTHEAGWDGRNEQGRQSASGVYFAHLDAGPDTRVTKIILLR